MRWIHFENNVNFLKIENESKHRVCVLLFLKNKFIDLCAHKMNRCTVDVFVCIQIYNFFFYGRFILTSSQLVKINMQNVYYFVCCFWL